jgi:two-component system, cell cycle sensor histidine kinase and response regulator CckA
VLTVHSMDSNFFMLLLARLGLDLVYALAYLGLAVLRPALPGPRWWWLACLMAALSTASLLPGQDASHLVPALLFGPFLSAGIMFAWLGVRELMGLSVPLLKVALTWVLFVVANTVLALGWDAQAGPRALLWLVVLAFAWLSIRNMKQVTRSVKQYEVLTSGWMAGIEIAAALVVLVSAPWWPKEGPALDLFNGVLIGVISFSVVIRGVVYAFFVSLRVQEMNDEAESRLSESEAELRTLIDNINAGVVVLRPDRTVVTANTAARAFLGWSSALPQAGLGSWGDLGRRFLRDDGSPMPVAEHPVEQVLANGRAVSDVLLGLQTDAQTPLRWALCNAFGQGNGAGELRRVVFTLVDITARQNAQAQKDVLEQQLAQSQKMEALGTLAGGVAHDFNNILAAILGNAELLRQDLEGDAEAQISLKEITVAARRGRELVRQVLAFSRRQPKQLTAVNVAEVLAESCQLLRAAMPSRVALVPKVLCHAPTIMADATQIGQVLVNLGSNALNAMADRAGEIEFRVECVAADDPGLPRELKGVSELGVVRIVVKDQGCGMTAAVRQRIFEPFFTTQMAQQSTGLGLPVVLGIVQSHGGEIRVDSEPQVGTSFTLYFPAVQPVAEPATADADLRPPEPEPELMRRAASDTEALPAQPLPAATHTAPALSRTEVATREPVQGPASAQPAAEVRSVLYLDDDPALVFLVRGLLQRRGFKVLALSDQRAAIDAVAQNPGAFGLFLTDYKMPGMSGLEVASAVLAINRKLPVALTSGYITEELQEEVMALGVREVVFKTDAVEVFCDVVTRLMGSGPA